MTGYKRVGKYLGGNNQKAYLNTNPNSLDFGYVEKELEPEFHGDSPHKHWKGERRADAAVEAPKVFPDLFPETEKIGPGKIRMKYVKGGITFGDALKNSDFPTLYNILRKLKIVHDKGYIHGDVNEENIQHGPVLSVDTETFGRGNRFHDLKKAMDIVYKKGRGKIADYFNKVIVGLYGEPVLE
ncbi:MAG: hypothetical protein V3U72_00705 [Candidatus Aenigmarchaeota archaeon]